MKRVLLIGLVVVVAALAGLAAWHLLRGGGSGPAGPAAAVSVPDGFQHDGSFDAQGYFMPTTEIKVGQLKLNHIAFGAISDFEAWEAGEREGGVFGPVALQFDDVTSPLDTNEMGGEAHEKQVRVLPTAYRFYPGEVSFKGTGEGLGEVRFTGRIDQAALAAGKESGASDKTAVLTGDLQVGAQVFRGVTFTYFMGD